MWYYIDGGEQVGPVNDAELDLLMANGRVTPKTSVWREGMAGWEELAVVPRPTAAGLPTLGTCSVCGHTFPSDQLIDLLNHRVCAGCKPQVVQSLREGVAPATVANVWADKKRVVTVDKAILPHRCFKCNQPATGASLKRKLYWHHPAIYLLLLLRLVPYVIVALIVRKRATVEVFLCERHLHRRKSFIYGGWLAAFLSIGVLVTGIAMNKLPITLAGFSFFAAAIIGGLWGANVTRAVRIKDKKVWMSGAGKEFLASLPEWQP